MKTSFVLGIMLGTMTTTMLMEKECVCKLVKRITKKI